MSIGAGSSRRRRRAKYVVAGHAPRAARIFAQAIQRHHSSADQPRRRAARRSAAGPPDVERLTQVLGLQRRRDREANVERRGPHHRHIFHDAWLAKFMATHPELVQQWKRFWPSEASERPPVEGAAAISASGGVAGTPAPFRTRAAIKVPKLQSLQAGCGFEVLPFVSAADPRNSVSSSRSPMPDARSASGAGRSAPVARPLAARPVRGMRTRAAHCHRHAAEPRARSARGMLPGRS